MFTGAITTSEAPPLISLFFGLLFAGLFFGDGKQAVVEVYGAATVLIVWFFRMSWHGPLSRTLPRSIMLSWVGVFIATALSASTSDSLGFSLSWCIRLLSGYLIYRLFYDVASEKTEKIVSGGLLAFVSGASIVSMVFMMTPGLQKVMPSMNLLGRSFGHNHLADLLVFISPLVWNRVVAAPIIPGIGIIVLYAATLSSTLARVAWGLVSVFFVFAASRNRKTRAGYKFVLVACLVVILGVFYFGKLFIGLTAKKTNVESYTRPRSGAVRFEYWRQAMEGFVARPITGSGPGTFSLVSSQYQRLPLSSSWFAHSQPLQILAEMGLLGIVAFGVLVFSHVRLWYRHRNILMGNQTSAALLTGCALIVVYSLFEFVLDYFIVWLLFFAVVGFVTGRPQIMSRVARKGGTRAALIIVSMFYVFWISSNGVGLFTKRYDAAFFLAPFDSVQTLLYLEESGTAKETGAQVAQLFHKKNPQILAALSKNMQKNGATEEATRLSREAAFADPQNIELVGQHFTRLASGDANTEIIGNDFLSFLSRSTPKRLQPQINALVAQTQQLGESVGNLYREKSPPLQEGYVSLVYLIGLNQLTLNAQATEKLWRLAIDMNPDFAAMYIELAMYYQHVRHSDEKAQRVLRECIKRESPKQQCAAFLDKDLLPPGDFYEALR